MLRNYIAAALRNFFRNKLYAAINVIGLTVGFAAALLIGLFVRDELTYDTWIPGHENVYRLTKSFYPPGGRTDRLASTSAAEPLWFKQDLPQVIAIGRLLPEVRGLRHGTVEANETVVWTDQDFFRVFPLDAAEGDITAALTAPDTVVLTENVARKFFGRTNVVGESLEIDRKLVLRVTAVLKNPPSRSHLNIGILASSLTAISPLSPSSTAQASTFQITAYLRLAPHSLAAVQEALVPLIDRHIPPITAGAFNPGDGPLKWGADKIMTYDLQPLADVHMVRGYIERANYGVLRPSGDRAMIQALVITGGLILLVAVANFVNLMTARAGRRAVEVGVRKVSGALRPHLVAQFVGESLLYVAASLMAALALTWSFLPAYGAFLDRAFDITSLGLDGAAAIAVIAAAVTLLGGFYPALVMSGYRPASALKSARLGAGGSGILRQGLVIAQFSVLIGLIVATVVIARQTAFAMASGFRLETDQILVVTAPCQGAFRTEVTALAGVRGVACADANFIDGVQAISLQTLPDGTKFTLNNFNAGAGLFELYGLKPLAGRFLDEARDANPAPRAGDPPLRRKVVINEMAARSFGYASPDLAIGQHFPGGDNGQFLAPEIVGVVADFPMRSLREAIAPAAYALPRNSTYLIAKLDGVHISEALSGIDAAWDRTNTDGRPIQRRFYDQYVQAQYVDMSRQSQAFQILAAIAIVIAGLGLFGLSAFTAETRTKEIGIRKSMGASSADVLRLLLWQFTRPVLAANLIAWPATYLLLTRWLETFAYRISLAPWIFVVASAAAVLIALVTVTGHTVLVARARPVTALRYE